MPQKPSIRISCVNKLESNSKCRIQTLRPVAILPRQHKYGRDNNVNLHSSLAECRVGGCHDHDEEDEDERAYDLRTERVPDVGPGHLAD